MLITAESQNSAENRRYLIGLGANLPSRHGAPLETLVAALAALEDRNIKILARSPWFESEPVPRSDQAWFVNGAIYISTLENSYNLLKILHDIEIEFGRVRSIPNAPRPLDLDLLAQINAPPDKALGPEAKDFDLTGKALVLPHPRLHERGFVLRPLLTIAPEWQHPHTGLSVREMAAKLPNQPVVRLLQG
jgi:2-amino-4-hydroxy-6-hydroxymethyldihydropteridine diphosphokinase